MPKELTLSMATKRRKKRTNIEISEVFPRLETEDEGNIRLILRLKESKSALKEMISRGYIHWIIPYSGGKDSTATVIVALETALELAKNGSTYPKSIDIVYSDTQVEIPIIKQHAIEFLNFLKDFERIKKLPVKYHIVHPDIEESFWVCLIGKGYPPPHQLFRWCTHRLKIRPIERAFQSLIKPNKTIIITGVRFGESKNRDIRLMNSCKRGGECGHGVWFQYSSRLKIGYLAPIVNWLKCDVWDFLNLEAPSLGYPTHYLEEKIYKGRNLRFGCWICTVVKQDKTMENLTSNPEYSYLKPLLEFRNWIIQITSVHTSREKRPDGTPGRLKLSIRKRILRKLLELQSEMGISLITEEEINLIKMLWENPKYRGYEHGNR